MVRLLLFGCLLFILQGSIAQDKVSWSEEFPLSWANFETRQNPGFGFRALTFSGISYQVNSMDGYINIEIKSFFIPEKSWVQEGFKNEYLLSHEQLHFDITEIFARKMRKAMSEYEISVFEFTSNNYQNDLEVIYDRIYLDMVKFQEEYDEATDHSLNRAAQIKWHDRVKKMLKDLDKYRE